MSKNSLKAAALAAAKVNAMLYAKGKLKLPDAQKNSSAHGVGERSLDSLVTREYEINDVPVPARNLLTRGVVQDEICKYSGASISTRGRYLTFEERLNGNTKDRPLYLHIQGSSKEAVNLALARIQEMISQVDKNFKPTIEFSDASFPPPRHNSFNGSGISGNPSSSGGHYVQDKVFVGLESTSSAFSVRERILGPNGSYLQHIKTESGATVTLRGRGSGYIEPTSGQEAFEPLYIHLTHPKPEGLQAAKTLALNLIDTVHTEYALFQQQSEQALMPISMGAPTHLPFQAHVPVVSSVPAVLSHSIMRSAAPGVYNPNRGTNFGFQQQYVNTISEVPPSSVPTLNSVPLTPMTSVNLNPVAPTVTLNPVTSIPLRGGPAVPIGSVPQVSLDAVPAPVSINTVPSGLVAPSVALNPVTSMPLCTVSSMPMTPVNSMPLSTMASLPVNPVTSMSLNTMAQISVNLGTSVPQNLGAGPSVPVNLLPPGSTTNCVSALPVEPAMALVPPQIPMMHMPPAPPPQTAPGYREHLGAPPQPMGPAAAVSLPPQPLPPTTYTHLYLKQQQQQQQQQMGPPPVVTGPVTISQGHKRKFREEGPDSMVPSTPVMTHHSPYSLQAGASLAAPNSAGPGPGAVQENVFLEPACPPPPVPAQQGQPQLATSRHPARRDLDRDLMPPPNQRMMLPPLAPAPMSNNRGHYPGKPEGSKVNNRSHNGDTDSKRFKGALSGLAALYNSDDSDEEAGSGPKSGPINNHD